MWTVLEPLCLWRASHRSHVRATWVFIPGGSSKMVAPLRTRVRESAGPPAHGQYGLQGRVHYAAVPVDLLGERDVQLLASIGRQHAVVGERVQQRQVADRRVRHHAL